MAMTALAGTAMLAHGNSPTRGKYARNVQGAVEYLVRCATPTGLLTGPSQDGGQPMHGHGFALMFLACVYGMITKETLRQKVQAAVRKAVALTSQGQSLHGGWTYIPGAGDEGLGDGHAGAGPAGGAQRGVSGSQGRDRRGGASTSRRCRTPEGGIQYSLLLRRRTQAADLGGGGRDALQRRPVRQHHRDRLPEIRLGPVPRQRRMGQGRRPRLLRAPLCRPGILHGGRPVLGQVLPRHPRPVARHAGAAKARGTATGSARFTERRSPRSSCSFPTNIFRSSSDRREDAHLERHNRPTTSTWPSWTS